MYKTVYIDYVKDNTVWLEVKNGGTPFPGGGECVAGCHVVQADHMPVGHRGLTVMVFAIRVTGIISLGSFISSHSL